MIGWGPRSNCAMADSSGWGARNSDGSTNTLFTSADGFSSAFVCLGRHSFLGGRLSSLRGRLTCSARSGRAFLSTSRYFAFARQDTTMGDGTYLLLLAQKHLWAGTSHGHPDVFWAPSAGTPMSRPAGVLEA